MPVWTAAVLLLMSSTGVWAQTARIVVVDQSGAPIEHATVAAGGTTAETSADGGVDWTGGGEPVTVTARGFASVEVTPSPGTEVRVVLVPAALTDRVTVTATRGDARLATPASTTVLTSAEVLTSAAGAVDDLLRYTPGFSLFRRSSSRTANPTTQGVTLRGASGSGASRTLVLTDGVPLNDPFGSWVYWNHVPQAAIDRVEVLRGTTGDLYGAEALGGVVQVLTFRPGAPRVRAFLEGEIARHRARVALRRGQPRRVVALRFGRSRLDRRRLHRRRGSARRGRYPRRQRLPHRRRRPGLAATMRRGANLRVSGFREERGNGTPLQVNDTTWRQGALTGGGAVAAGAWQAAVSHGSQDYFQTFTALAADRSERASDDGADNPDRLHPGLGTVDRQPGRHSYIVGGELHDTEGTTEESATRWTNARTGPFLRRRRAADRRVPAGALRARRRWTLWPGPASTAGSPVRSTRPCPTAPRRSSALAWSLAWQRDGLGRAPAPSRSYRTRR